MAVLIPVIFLGAQGRVAAQIPGCSPNGNGTSNINNNVVNTVNDQFQTANAVGGGDADSYSNSSAQGGTATVEVGETVNWNYSESTIGDQVNWSDNDSVSSVNIETTSISNYKGRVAPLGTYPPYLPMWNHGGWGTVQAYFPNGPTTYDTVYEKAFDPANADDMHELKGVLASLSYEGPLHFLGGMLNGVRVLLGGPDQFHRGRGFEIANSVARDRRPEGKPLLVFIDSKVDAQLLEAEGYAYVGRLSLEGEVNRNWDHLYNAALAEALPWDVDILLVSGGMKGVTVGTNTSFPSASYGYSQTNYSLALFGGKSRGITEGKGEPVLSASAYRFCPELLERRRLPQGLYDRIRRRPPVAAAAAATPAQQQARAMAATAAQQKRVAMPTDTGNGKKSGPASIRELYDVASVTTSQQADPAIFK
ncbi:MAG: hypothetical protein JW741_04275 [Sedimentisphaerales bacterium]|nr:hypothetical protein [Sedimentisphaerales bacterium]